MQTPIKEETLVEKVNEFRTGNTKLFSSIKNIVFKDYQNEDASITKVEQEKLLIESIRYIVEEVLELTPEEYDSIYNAALNQKIGLSNALRKLTINASEKILCETLFDSQKTVFRLVWPEYYKSRYPEVKPWDVFNATGKTKSSLVQAARVREVKEEKEDEGAKQLANGRFSSERKISKTVASHGACIDDLVYWSMSQIIPSFFEARTPELFLSLARPKSAGWSNYGFVRIIKARECYPTPLDFWMWNSPIEYQKEHFEEYLHARKIANLEPIPILDYIAEGFEKYYNGNQRT